MDKKIDKRKSVVTLGSKKKPKTNLVDTMLMEFAKKVSKKWDFDEGKKLDSLVMPVGVKVQNDIYYNVLNTPDHSLDVYYKGAKNKPRPVVIDIHGGGFVSGSKQSDKFFCAKLAEMGFLVLSINYTLSIHGANIFDNIHEVHIATEYIISHLKEYGCEASPVYLCGHSAGGMLAAIEVMLSLSPELCEVYNLSQLKVKFAGLILDCGFMKFYDKNLPYAMFRRVVFPSEYEKDERYKFILFEKSEILKQFPKTFIFTNNKDDLKGMSVYFYKLLKKHNAICQLERAKTGGHVGIIYAPDSEDSKMIFSSMLKFFEL